MRRPWSLQLVDAIGGAAVVACLLGFVWMTVLQDDAVRRDLDQVSRLTDRARKDHGTLTSELDRQRALLVEYRVLRSRIGQLPSEAPIEDYFQHLSVLAVRHHLRVVRQRPLASRRYPGLLEQRFLYEVMGSVIDLVAFLKSIENAEFWADVSHLKTERGPGGLTAADHEIVAALTVSLFSGLAIDKAAQSEGT